MANDDTERIDALARLWRDFGERDVGDYSPLYSTIACAVADNRELLLRIADDVSARPQLPLAILAAVHDLVLRGADPELARLYAERAVEDAVPAFFACCDAHWDEIVDLLRSRQVQTNECGRSAVLALGIAAIEGQYGELAALVDAGASAGLNLLYDRFHLDYSSLGSLGDPSSPVRVTCDVRTPSYVLPARAPAIARRVGIDRQPIDATNADDRRWLLACVWPDTGRLERTAAALDIAAAHPPDVRPGDMVDDLAATIDGLDTEGSVCVLTSWSAAYLPPRRRQDFVAVLDEVGMRREVFWLSFEAPGLVDLFTPPADRDVFDIVASAMGVVRFCDGARDGRALALVHPHGNAIVWV